MDSTPEQTAVIKSTARNLTVKAFAGAGKTSTLVGYAQARPTSRLLYVAFNKGIQMEAKRKFPRNVECRTTHSLAFGRFGKPLAHKFSNNLRPFDLMRHAGYDNARFARLVTDTLTSYMSSADETPNLSHVDLHLAGDQAPRIVDHASVVWKRMIDPMDPMSAVHDTYLKLWQLSRPELPYDTILFDEGQDANPVTTDVVLRQSCGKVFVGDPHQSIYGFRGAENAMESFKSDETLNLTHSFRFGQGVADCANLLLSELKGEIHPITGRGKYQTKFEIDQDLPCLTIARTNAYLFEEAAMAVLLGHDRIGYVGGVQGYKLEMILDAYRLWVGYSDIRDMFIRMFATFDAMKIYGEEADDKEVNMLVRVIESRGHDIPVLVERIRAIAESHDSKRGDPPIVTLSTAHKVKGLEFDQVRLGDDFTELVDGGALVETIDPEEVNVLYVAMTRAERAIQLNAQFREFAKLYDTIFRSSAQCEQPVMPKASQQNSPQSSLF